MPAEIRGDATVARVGWYVEPGHAVPAFALAAGLKCTEKPVAVDVADAFALAGVQALAGDLGVLREFLEEMDVIEVDEAVRLIALMLELVFAKAAPERRGVLLLGVGNKAHLVTCTGSKSSGGMLTGVVASWLPTQLGSVCTSGSGSASR